MIRRSSFFACLIAVLGAAGGSLGVGAVDDGAIYDIVFDSNRSGTFGIYRMSVDGAGVAPVVDLGDHELYPSPSRDGQWVAYARALDPGRGAEADVYICRPDGTENQLVVRDGTFPEFSADGRWIYFERGREFLMKVPVTGGDAVRLVPRAGSLLLGSSLVKPRVSPDGRLAAIITNYPGTWFVGIVEIATGELTKVGYGCEPAWFDQGRKLVWVSSRQVKERTGIKAFTLADNAITTVQDDDAPFGHEYFPWMEEGGGFLLWASCPPKQHDHADSNYQIFFRRLPSGAPQRLTHDKFTNRWPRGLRIRKE